MNTFSGDESFLASLALALALADLRRSSLRLGILFLDESLGSLDEDTLDTALSVLEQLQADQNTQILIISHVGALKERIDPRWRPEPDSPLRSLAGRLYLAGFPDGRFRMSSSIPRAR